MLKSVGIYTSFNFLNLVLGLISVPILTRLILPDEYGLLGLVLSLSVFLFPIISICSETLVQVEAVEKHTKLDDSYFISSTLSFSFIIFVVVFFIIYILTVLTDLSSLFLLSPVLVFVQVLRRFYSAYLVVKDKSVFLGISNLSFSVLSFFLSLTFLFYIEASASSRLYGLIFSELIIFIFLNYLIIKVFFVFNSTTYKYIYSYGLPLILTSIPAWFLNEYGRYFLSENGSLRDIAMITIALQISALYFQFNKSIYNSVLKNAIENDELELSKKFLLFLFQTILLAVSLLGVYFIFDLWVGGEYLNAKGLTYFFLIANYIQSLSILSSTYLNKYKKNSYRFIIVLICSLCNVLFVTLLFPDYGIYAIPYSSLISFLLYTVTLNYTVNHLKSIANV